MNLRKKVAKKALHTEYVNILNGILQLSKREAEVFSFILTFDAEGYDDNINSAFCRQIIIDALSISESNLSRYLNTLKSKGLIVKSPSNKWILNDNLRPPHKDIVEVTFSLEVDNTPREGNKGYSKEIQEGSEGDQGDGVLTPEIRE